MEKSCLGCLHNSDAIQSFHLEIEQIKREILASKYQSAESAMVSECYRERILRACSQLKDSITMPAFDPRNDGSLESRLRYTQAQLDDASTKYKTVQEFVNGLMAQCQGARTEAAGYYKHYVQAILDKQYIQQAKDLLEYTLSTHLAKHEELKHMLMEEMNNLRQSLEEHKANNSSLLKTIRQKDETILSLEEAQEKGSRRTLRY